jgi:hypothetical protein
MANVLDTRIAPKLNRTTHKPMSSGGKGIYWFIKDYPGHREHGKDGAHWVQQDWDIAINIFEDRIYGRFLNQISLIERRLSSGFAVMALDCLLCETLEQFYEGKEKSERYGKTFINFLTTSPSSFLNFFGTDDNKDTSLAGVFYDQIRCGILHQAEAKKTSLVVFDDKEPLIGWIDTAHSGVIVNRKKFHKQLKDEFKSYLDRLRSQPAKYDQEPWGNFKKKMDLICKI